MWRLTRHSLSSLFAICIGLPVDAGTVPVVPHGVILVKGATPGTSDSVTPLPEEGKVAGDRYNNAYFNLSYPIPAGWTEEPAGPPPSDGGSYVLTQFAFWDREPQRVKAHVLVSAQDLFFSANAAQSARELMASLRRGVVPQYEIERGPEEVKIASRTFYRVAYGAPIVGLHWRVLSTDARCHALTFTFTGRDKAALDAAERAMSGISLAKESDAPLCVKGYAHGDNVIEKTEPYLATRRFNTIPVRVTIDGEGRVKHVHLLSAFPDQSEAIISALRAWRLKPYIVDGKPSEIETGLVFGTPRAVARGNAAGSARR
ncbi:MAG TPA: hypothetical protein VGQ65_18000 [Thermoanaerobaculia bacterium]|jgi:hypothetical protein|nr:hypothetical protein [Thermoanaerobaculia bacterium]